MRPQRLRYRSSLHFEQARLDQHDGGHRQHAEQQRGFQYPVRQHGGRHRTGNAAEQGRHQHCLPLAAQRDFSGFGKTAYAGNGLQENADAVAAVGDVGRNAEHHQHGQDQVAAAARHDVDNACQRAQEDNGQILPPNQFHTKLPFGCLKCRLLFQSLKQAFILLMNNRSMPDCPARCRNLRWRFFCCLTGFAGAGR